MKVKLPKRKRIYKLIILALTLFFSFLFFLYAINSFFSKYYFKFHKPVDFHTPITLEVHNLVTPLQLDTTDYTKEPTQIEALEETIRMFEPEGIHVVMRAINCFYSESGFRWDAVNNSNSNGSNDGGIVQQNSVHGKALQDRFNYKSNIEWAYKKYKKDGNFNAWYGAGCN